jgi:hypothetical protein
MIRLSNILTTPLLFGNPPLAAKYERAVSNKLSIAESLEGLTMIITRKFRIN